MKLLPLFLCLLLCGCAPKAQEAPTEVPTITTAATVPETEPVSMYQPGHPLEKDNRGALRVNPLTMRKVRGIQAMGDDIVVFSGYGSTTLTRLTGRDLTLANQVTLEFELDAQSPSTRTGTDCLSYYDPVRQEMVILDKTLQEVSRHPFPENIQGSPILSTDRTVIYYCTPNAIRAWDLKSGIHRTVKELSYDDQTLTGLHLNDMVLQCRIQDGDTVWTLFLAADTGRLLDRQAGDVGLQTDGGHYYASLPSGGLELLVFGITDATPRILYPEDTADAHFYLPSQQACVTAASKEEHTDLSYYRLDTGVLQSQILLPPLQTPKSVCSTSGGSVYILTYDPQEDCDLVYRWDVPQQDINKKGFTENYTQQSQGALTQCQAYASELGSKYGIQILIGKNALAAQPWDYEFQPETLHRILYQELEALDQRLSQYPQAMLEKTISHFSSLTLCLVRQITGTAESGSLEAATGVQFFDGSDAYVAITVGKYAEQALYHELFHVMETHILAESTAFDQWEDLNPAGFTYHYGTGLSPEMEVYLSDENRTFIDAYSTSFPKEDRARIMENAILPGNEALFRSPTLQAKLVKLCEGIRQAYGLKRSPESFIWEQYLNFPLAYSQ